MATVNNIFDAGMGTVWVQRKGPNTAAEFLECADLGDVGRPRPGVETRYAHDPRQINAYQVISQVRTTPDTPSTTLTTYLPSSNNVLGRATNCPIGVYALLSRCRKGDWSDWERIVQIQDAYITGDTLSNLAMREASDSSEQTWDLTFATREDIFPLHNGRQITVSVMHLYGLRFYNDLTCQPCGNALDPCDYGIAVGDTGVGVAPIYYTTTGGATWTVAAALPFAATEDIMASAVVRTATGYRWIVARGTTDAGNPAEIAYSDSATGAAWTLVNLGATNADFVPGWNGMWACNDTVIYVVTNLSVIFKSTDAGITWTSLGDMGANALWSCMFLTPDMGIVGGAANTILYTENGGTTWATITGPAAEAANVVRGLWMVDENRWWAIYSSGNLYYTVDAGVTWTERALDGYIGSAATAGNDVRFYDAYNGFCTVVHGTRLSSIMRTYDGGYTWTRYQHPVTFDNTAPVYGLAQLSLCGPNKAYAGGGLVGAVAEIAKVSD